MSSCLICLNNKFLCYETSCRVCDKYICRNCYLQYGIRIKYEVINYRDSYGLHLCSNNCLLEKLMDLDHGGFIDIYNDIEIKCRHLENITDKQSQLFKKIQLECYQNITEKLDVHFIIYDYLYIS